MRFSRAEVGTRGSFDFGGQDGEALHRSQLLEIARSRDDVALHHLAPRVGGRPESVGAPRAGMVNRLNVNRLNVNRLTSSPSSSAARACRLRETDLENYFEVVIAGFSQPRCFLRSSGKRLSSIDDEPGRRVRRARSGHLVEILGEIGGRRVAMVAVSLERALHDRREARRDLGHQRCARRGSRPRALRAPSRRRFRAGRAAASCRAPRASCRGRRRRRGDRAAAA